MGTLSLPEGARAELATMVREGYPLETCGLLVGLRGSCRMVGMGVPHANNLQAVGTGTLVGH